MRDIVHAIEAAGKCHHLVRVVGFRVVRKYFVVDDRAVFVCYE